MERIRRPAVAGAFYPGDPRQLAADVDELLDGVEQFEPRMGHPKALIVPHAGYIYSGPVAAAAYDELAPILTKIAAQHCDGVKEFPAVGSKEGEVRVAVLGQGTALPHAAEHQPEEHPILPVKARLREQVVHPHEAALPALPNHSPAEPVDEFR